MKRLRTARPSALASPGLDSVGHAYYSPDLAPRDYFLFSNLEKEPRGGRFGYETRPKEAVDARFETTERSYFREA